jgi:hypothetical protein
MIDYGPSEIGERIPPRVRHTSEELQLGSSVIAGPSRALKRTYAMLSKFACISRPSMRD